MTWFLGTSFLSLENPRMLGHAPSVFDYRVSLPPEWKSTPLRLSWPLISPFNVHQAGGLSSEDGCSSAPSLLTLRKRDSPQKRGNSQSVLTTQTKSVNSCLRGVIKLGQGCSFSFPLVDSKPLSLRVLVGAWLIKWTNKAIFMCFIHKLHVLILVYYFKLGL